MKIFGNSVIKGISLGLGMFVVAEIILRLMGFGDLEVYEYDPVLFWKLKPGQTCLTKINRKPVHVNNFGFRGKEIALEKPRDCIRILSVGDSRTYGWGVADDETYSAVLEKELNQRLRKRGLCVQILNNGVNAYSYPQIYESIRKNIERYNIDMVVVGMANLWTEFEGNKSEAFLKAWRRRLELKNLLRKCALFNAVVEVRLRELYIRYRQKFIPIEQDVRQREGEEAYKERKEQGESLVESSFEKIAQLLEEKGIPWAIIYIPYGLTTEGTYDYSLIEEIKQRHPSVISLDFNDVARQYDTSRLETLYCLHDPVHLSAEGNRLLGVYCSDRLLASPVFSRKGVH